MMPDNSIINNAYLNKRSKFHLFKKNIIVGIFREVQLLYFYTIRKV